MALLFLISLVLSRFYSGLTDPQTSTYLAILVISVATHVSVLTGFRLAGRPCSRSG